MKPGKVSGTGRLGMRAMLVLALAAEEGSACLGSGLAAVAAAAAAEAGGSSHCSVLAMTAPAEEDNIERGSREERRMEAVHIAGAVDAAAAGHLEEEGRLHAISFMPCLALPCLALPCLGQ